MRTTESPRGCRLGGSATRSSVVVSRGRAGGLRRWLDGTGMGEPVEGAAGFDDLSGERQPVDNVGSRRPGRPPSRRGQSLARSGRWCGERRCRVKDAGITPWCRTTQAAETRRRLTRSPGSPNAPPPPSGWRIRCRLVATQQPTEVPRAHRCPAQRAHHQSIWPAPQRDCGWPPTLVPARTPRPSAGSIVAPHRG